MPFKIPILEFKKMVSVKIHAEIHPLHCKYGGVDNLLI